MARTQPSTVTKRSVLQIITDVGDNEKNGLLTSQNKKRKQGIKITYRNTQRSTNTIVNPENGLIVPLNTEPSYYIPATYPYTIDENDYPNNDNVPFMLKHSLDSDYYRMGQFLHNHYVDGRTMSLQPRGLINPSNYCYINSILQALIACPPLYNLLSGLAEIVTSNDGKKPPPVIDGMCTFVKTFKHLPETNDRSSQKGKKGKKQQDVRINTDNPLKPAWIYEILHNLPPTFRKGYQEDAQEVLLWLLNKLNDEMLELMKFVEIPKKIRNQQIEDDESRQVMANKKVRKTPITDIFGGSLTSSINRIGGDTTEGTEPFMMLQLHVENVKTVSEALKGLTAKCQLGGLTCTETEEKVNTWRQEKLGDLPAILVLHLLCFIVQPNGSKKILKALEFPIDLKIDNNLLSPKRTKAKEKNYKLFAVVYHRGRRLNAGHYVTDAFHVGYKSWLRYDDASVKQVQEEDVLTPVGTRVPYLLFYRRSDVI